jgi:hypothetical protein
MSWRRWWCRRRGGAGGGWVVVPGVTYEKAKKRPPQRQASRRMSVDILFMRTAARLVGVGQPALPEPVRRRSAARSMYNDYKKSHETEAEQRDGSMMRLHDAGARIRRTYIPINSNPSATQTSRLKIN